MADFDGTYQPGVGKVQGGEYFYMDYDAYFYFGANAALGSTLKNILYLNPQRVIMINSAGVLSDQSDGTAPPILPSTYGCIVFSVADAMSNGSARMFSAYLGRELVLMTRGGGSTGSVLIYLSGHTSGISGVTVIGQLSGGLSSISIRNSANSAAFIRLRCYTEGTWTVLDNETAGVTLRAGA